MATRLADLKVELMVVKMAVKKETRLAEMKVGLMDLTMAVKTATLMECSTVVQKAGLKAEHLAFR